MFVGAFSFQQPDEWAWAAVRRQREKIPKCLISYRGKISTIPILREKKKDEQKMNKREIWLLLSPILMNFSIQGAWVRNPLWFQYMVQTQWFDAAGLSHRGESTTCFLHVFSKAELTEEKRRDEAFYPTDTSLTPMDFLWSGHGFLF
ncbi:unnamed protein product, partial [Prunus brigantina]